MTPHAEEKKRPPPIQVVARPSQDRVIPGPNAFAIAAQGKQDEVAKLGKHSNQSAPVTPSLDGSHLHPPDSQSRTRGSTKTTFGQVIDAARGSSPRKSDGHSSSTTSRHGSTALSRHSNRSYRSAASSRPGTSDGDDEKTARGQIESRTERKFFKMMGQIPPTPTSDNVGATVVNGGRYSEASIAEEPNEKKPEGPVKSPKKRIFGMSIPGFRTSANNAVPKLPPMAPPMAPRKAAQVLGTSISTGTSTESNPASKWRNTPRHPKQLRSDTSKSLPLKLYDHQNNSRRRPQNRTPVRKAPLNAEEVQWKDSERCNEPGGSTSDLGAPPTPPEKDTPRDNKGKDKITWDKEEQVQIVDVGDNHQLPTFLTTSNAVPSEGGQSPTKFCPYTAEEYAKLVEPQSIASAHAQIDDADILELEGDNRHPTFAHQAHESPNFANEASRSQETQEAQQNYPTWWNEERAAHFTSAFNGEPLPPLPPTYYSPSTFSLSLFEGTRPSHNTDKNHLVFTLRSPAELHSTSSDSDNASINMIFQGEASEIVPTSDLGKMHSGATQKSDPSSQKNDEVGHATRVMQEQPHGHQAEMFEGEETGSQLLQPEQSSSRLTDMLSGFSPARPGYNGFYANCPSALPSPLQGPVQQMTNSMMRPIPTSSSQSLEMLSDGSNILTHFYMLNTHMDVMGRTLYDLVDNGKRELVKETHDKHEGTVAVLDQRFEDIKSDISLLGQKVDDVSENHNGVNAKLEKLLHYIKSEVAEPLAKQSKKNADMENNIKSLQRAMQDLQKSIETKVSTCCNESQTQQVAQQTAQNPFSSPLPHHRSQPSLVGFFNPVSEAARETNPRMPPIPEMRNDGRFRHNYSGNSTQGQQWYRPSNALRETKDENQSFPTLNSYLPVHGSPSGQYNGGYMGGYGGYYQSSPNDQSFGYNTK